MQETSGSIWERITLTAGMLIGSALLASAETDPGPVNMTDREAARSWFNTWWPKSFGAPMGFTGNIDAGIPGDISPAYRDQTLLRLNIFRRMAGEQPVVTNPVYDAKDQAAAALCAANDGLQHNPPTNWKFYNATAAEGCANSALAASAGSHGVVDLITDFGTINKAVGHRISLLTPSMTTVGIGTTPGHSNSGLFQGVLTVWGADPSVWSNNINYSEPFVLWPAKGYIPFYLIPGRWSAVIPDGLSTGTVNLVNANVTVTQNGRLMPVKQESLIGGDAVIFTLDGTNEGDTGFAETAVNGEALNGLPLQTSDVVCHVTISNIKVRTTGVLWNGTGKYEYDVIAYNPSVAPVVPGAAANLVNISTRSFAGSDSSTQIAGFIISGSVPRKVLIRAGGPYLSQFGVDSVLPDPVLTLIATGGTQLAQNDDWSSDAAAVTAAVAKVGTLPFTAGSKDAAIVTTLLPGAYTAQVMGKGNATGNALVEVFDADDGSASKLTNISTRSFVGAGSSVQIGGFILRGSGPRKVLIRAGGPYLTQYGVSNVLADPVLTVFKGNTQISQNDDWGSNSAEVTAATQALGAIGYTVGSKDAAVVLILDPGVGYTAQVAGKNGGTGNALVEVFQLPDDAP